MRISALLLVGFTAVGLAVPASAQGHKHPKVSAKILSAKSVYLDDQIGVPAVGSKTLNQLKKWGRFQIVQERTQADLIFQLTADAYKGGQVIFSGGQTGTMGRDGNINADSVPTFNKISPVRYAYLTVIDPKTGQKLWSDCHQWGGLLTGFNSVGERLVKELEKQTRR